MKIYLISKICFKIHGIKQFMHPKHSFRISVGKNIYFIINKWITLANPSSISPFKNYVRVFGSKLKARIVTKKRKW